MPALLRITATGRFVRTAPRIALPIRTVQRSIRACGACARREFERHAPTRRCCLPLEPEARRFVVDVAGRVQRAHERAERGPAGVLARRLHVLQQEQREVDLSKRHSAPQRSVRQRWVHMRSISATCMLHTRHSRVTCTDHCY
eukprot:6213464-Pleurochrysis_carterae.AAC.3